MRSGARSAGVGVEKASDAARDEKGCCGVPSAAWRAGGCALGALTPTPDVTPPVAGDRRAPYVGAAACGDSRNSRGRPATCEAREHGREGAQKHLRKTSLEKAGYHHFRNGLQAPRLRINAEDRVRGVGPEEL